MRRTAKPIVRRSVAKTTTEEMIQNPLERPEQTLEEHADLLAASLWLFLRWIKILQVVRIS